MDKSESRGAVSFSGMRVAAFESRRAEEIATLIENLGGVPFVSPALREVPIANNSNAVEFGKLLITGHIDMVIFLTGVGFQFLWDFLIRQVDVERLRTSLADTITIARGPKPVAAMKAVGLIPTYQVPAPNTWRELLQTIDQELSVSNWNVAIQEYGESNTSLVAGLEARGARVQCVPVYRWDLPLDLGPLQDNVRAICAGDREMLLFTTSQQVVHILRIAKQMKVEPQFTRAMQQSVVGSIGPSTSDALRQAGFPVDFVPSRPKLGVFVREAAIHGADLQNRKRRIVTSLASPHSDVLDRNAPWYNSLFMKACRREPTEVTPVWFMRQCSRYLPEYRALRKQFSFAELCKRPHHCAELMVMTVRRLAVDAGIIFADLLAVLEPMGMDLEYITHVGPTIHNPIRQPEDVDQVFELDDLGGLDFVLRTVELTRSDLPEDIPLIGFAGGPFTLASYAIEGGSSKNLQHTKALMYRDEGAWNELMGRFSRAVARFLNAQIRSGVQCVQIIDSWAGCLNPDDYRKFVLPHMCDTICHLSTAVPVISFTVGNPLLLPLLAEANPTIVACDWRIRLEAAWRQIGPNKGIQGNLDPAVLLAAPSEVARRTRDILRQADGRPGHIFNLGQGILPATPVENVLRVVDEVHRFRG